MYAGDSCWTTDLLELAIAADVESVSGKVSAVLLDGGSHGKLLVTLNRDINMDPQRANHYLNSLGEASSTRSSNAHSKADTPPVNLRQNRLLHLSPPTKYPTNSLPIV